MRLLVPIAAALFACLAAACSAVPDSETAQQPGYHGHTYVLTAEEQAYDCKSVAFMIDKSVQAINAMPAQAKVQRDGPPSSMVHAMQRVSGNGIPVLEDYKRERARLKALTDVRTKDGCPAIDVEAQIKDASDKLTVFRKEFRGKG